MQAFVAPWLNTNPLSFVDAAKAGAEIGNAAHTALLSHEAAMANIEAEKERAAAELQMAKQNFLARMGYNQGRLEQGQERLGQGQERIDQSGQRMGNLEDYRDSELEARNRGLDIQQQNANKPKVNPWSFLTGGGLPNPSGPTGTTGTGTAPGPDESSGAIVNPPSAADMLSPNNGINYANGGDNLPLPRDTGPTGIQTQDDYEALPIGSLYSVNGQVFKKNPPPAAQIQDVAAAGTLQ